MNENETVSFEERTYAIPTVSRDEQTAFIQSLRDNMAQKTNQVNADTYALGSQLPSNLGGLSGAEATFEARYRTPQIEQTTANLRLAAQQSALNTALSNLQNAWKKRYNDAILNYQRRSARDSLTPSSTQPKGNVNVKTPEPAGSGESFVQSSQAPNSTTIVVDGENIIQDTNTGNIIATDRPEDHPNKDGWYLTNKVDGLGRPVVSNVYNGMEISLEEYEWMGGKL